MIIYWVRCRRIFTASHSSKIVEDGRVTLHVTARSPAPLAGVLGRVAQVRGVSEVQLRIGPADARWPLHVGRYHLGQHCAGAGREVHHRLVAALYPVATMELAITIGLGCEGRGPLPCRQPSGARRGHSQAYILGQ